MTTSLKAIETVYKGYRFRSRLEARWAVYFDTLGCEWEYEPEGFDLGEEGFYLPDFWLKTVNMWAEIKAGKLSDDELGKVNALAAQGKSPVLMLVGTPALKSYYMSFWCTKSHRGLLGSIYLAGGHVEYVDCHLAADLLHTEGRWPLDPNGKPVTCPVAQKAVDAARSARFEHGESGAPG